MPSIELRHGQFYLTGRTDKLSKEHVIEALRQLEEDNVMLRKKISRTNGSKSCGASLDEFGCCVACGFVSSLEVYAARRIEAMARGTEGV